MHNISELKDCVNQTDYYNFLRIYIYLVKEGENLNLPITNKFETVKNEWESILFFVAPIYTEEFIDNLSLLWLGVLDEYKGFIDKDFAQKMLAILVSGVKLRDIEGSKEEKKPEAIDPKYKKKGVEISSEKYKDVGVAQFVNKHITNKYYKEKEAIDFEAPKEDLLDNGANQAIKKKDSNAFLVNYLSYSKYDVLPVLPKTTIKETIKADWESILKEKFSAKLDDGFLDSLSKRWFYLVNAYGLPINIEKCKNLLTKQITLLDS
jgi:hypothetical protein